MRSIGVGPDHLEALFGIVALDLLVDAPEPQRLVVQAVVLSEDARERRWRVAVLSASPSGRSPRASVASENAATASAAERRQKWSRVYMAPRVSGVGDVLLHRFVPDTERCAEIEQQIDVVRRLVEACLPAEILRQHEEGLALDHVGEGSGHAVHDLTGIRVPLAGVPADRGRDAVPVYTATQKPGGAACLVQRISRTSSSMNSSIGDAVGAASATTVIGVPLECAMT